MKSIYNFIITPLNERYENEVMVGDKKLIVNTSIEEFRFISKRAKVLSVPIAFNTDIREGDEVIVHHNIFRRWYDVRGVEKNSAQYFEDNKYFCNIDQIYLYKKNNQYKPNLNYCFVKPLVNKHHLRTQKEKPLIGVMKYPNSFLEDQGITRGSIVTFRPDSEFEFLINEERLYCMKSNDIVINHGYKEDEEEYNPSWASSSR
jgi:hypothetical protein